MVMPSGTTMIGQFKQNQLNGPGEIFDIEDNRYLKGNFVNGTLFGKGKLIHYKDADRKIIKAKIEGEFFDGQPHGYAKVQNFDEII